MSATTNPTAADRRATLLAAYDTQLREAAEFGPDARWDRDGPVYRAVFEDGFGMVGYRDLRGYDQPGDGDRLDELISRTIEHFSSATAVSAFEWKTRGHDLPPDLADRLVAAGFVADDAETVMIGEAELLAQDLTVPDGIVLRRIGIDQRGEPADEEQARRDVTRMLDLQSVVFGPGRHHSVDTLVTRLMSQGDVMGLWIAETDTPRAAASTVVTAGRLEVVPGTDFAGIWGGATLPEWRGRGIYRALTAARARSAISKGARYLNSDSTEFSRPILERSGLIAVTTTTPYVWARPSTDVTT